MKIIGIVILYLILYKQSLSQSCLRLVRPSFPILETNDIKNLKLMPCKDSEIKLSNISMRIVQFTDLENCMFFRVVFKCYYDSLSNFHSTFIEKNLNLTKDGQSISNTILRSPFYRIDLLIPDSTYQPISLEDSIIIGYPKPRITNMLLGLAPEFKRNLFKENQINASAYLKIKGTIIFTGQFADGKLNGQGIPENYLRTQINLMPEIMGIPFNTTYYTTTENSTDFHGIDNYRMSFDYASFYSKLKNRLDTISDLNKLKKNGRITKFDIEKINKESSKLKGQLNNQAYQNQILNDKNILNKLPEDSLLKLHNIPKISKPVLSKNISEKYAHDSLNNYRRRYKKVTDRMNQYDAKLRRLKALDSLKYSYTLDSIRINFEHNVEDFNSNSSKGFKKNLKKYGIYKSQYDFFLSLKKLDFGTFDPAYTALVLGGISLKGINTEINYGNLYGAFTYGSVANTFNYRSFLSNKTSEQTILACRVGIGRTEKMLCAVSFLKGTDNGENLIKDSNSLFQLPEKNYVLGLDIRYKLSDYIDFGAEYAKSISQNREKVNGNDESHLITNLISSNSNKYSNAWTGYCNINFKGNTKIHVMGRQVDPFYYSFGTPFLRKDNFRIEAKVEQYFWKKQFLLAVTGRNDRDNIYELKEATSMNLTTIYLLQLKVKKFPFFIANYSPNYQSNFNGLTKQAFSSSVIYYGLTSGYIFQNREISLTSTINYSRQFSSTLNQGYSFFDISQYMISENVHLKKVDIVFCATINFTFPELTDTGRVYYSNFMVSKTSNDKKMSSGVGYVYQKDFGTDIRNCFQANVSYSFPWAISGTLKFEKQFIKKHINGESNNLSTGRIIIIKSF